MNQTQNNCSLPGRARAAKLSLNAKLLFALFLSAFLLAGMTTNAQGYQKVVDLNADARTIHTTLPYNQNILFRVKSKNYDLSKVTFVMILRHKGNLNFKETLEKYNSEETTMKFYQLDKNYVSKDSVLEVSLRDHGDSISDSKKRPDFVLFPSTQYSLLLYQGKVFGSEETELATLVRKYIKDSVGNAASLNASRKAADDKVMAMLIKADKAGDVPESLLSLEHFTKAYADKKYYGVDTVLLNAENKWSQHSNTLSAIEGSPVIDILLKILREGDSKCLKKFVCDVPNCKLYESLSALLKLNSSNSLSKLLDGTFSLSDIENIFYKPGKLSPANRLANIDSTRKYVQAVITVFRNILLDNTLIETDGTVYKKFIPCMENLPFKALTDYRARLADLMTAIEKNRVLLMDIVDAENKQKEVQERGMLFFQKRVISADTYVYSFETRSNYSIVPMFGYAVYGFQKGFTSFTPYTGFILGMQHLDEDVPFRLLKKKRVMQRVSFTMGFTLSSLKEDGKRYDFFGNSTNLLTGFGFKLSHVVTLNGGSLWFRKENPDPFITRKNVAATPYFSISINMKIKKIFEGFTSLVPLK